MGKIVGDVYYGSSGKPSHRGIVEVDEKLYYAGKDGVIVKDKEKRIHHGMANGLAQHGTYYFDKDGVIDLSSFKKSKSSSNTKTKTKKESNRQM